MVVGADGLKAVLRHTNDQQPATPITNDNMDDLALLQKSHDGDFLRLGAETALQRLMEYYVEKLMGIARH